MVTIRIDLHKQTHSAAATDALGSELARPTVTARREGFGQLLDWCASGEAGELRV